MYRRFLSVRYFRTRLVNWLSVAGVMVGVAVMIVVWSVFSGFQVEVRKSIRGTLSDIEMVPDGTTRMPSEARLGEVLAAAPDVVAWTPRLTTYVGHPYKSNASVLSGVGSSVHFMEAVGIDWAREAKSYAAAKSRGSKDPTGLPRFLTAKRDEADPFHSPYADEKWGPDAKTTAIFSQTFLDTFVGGADRPEDYLDQTIEMIFFRERMKKDDDPTFEVSAHLRVIVSAVYDGRDHDADSRRVYFDRAKLWRVCAPVDVNGVALVAEPAYTQVCVTVADYEQADDIRDRLREVLAARLAPASPPPDAPVSHGGGFRLFSWQDQRAPLLKAVGTEKVLLAIVIAFIGLLAGFTILATLTLTVVEKTRDIGVLMALGATSRGVMSVFLRSGVLIGVLGGVLGLGLGVALTESLEPIRLGLKKAFDVDLFPPDIYLFDHIPYVYNLEAMGFIVLGCMLVAFLAGLLPSLRAARMDPIVALRHE